MSKTCRQAFLANRLTQAIYMLVKKVKHWANKCDRYFPLRTTSSWWGWMNTDFTFIMWWEKGQQALSNWTDYIRAVLLPPSGLVVIKWSIMQLLRSYFFVGEFCPPCTIWYDWLKSYDRGNSLVFELRGTEMYHMGQMHIPIHTYAHAHTCQHSHIKCFVCNILEIIKKGSSYSLDWSKSSWI